MRNLILDGILVLVLYVLFTGKSPTPAVPPPIPLPGLNVLIVEDNSGTGQSDEVWHDPQVIDALEECNEYRIWDDEVDLKYAPEEFKAAFAKAKTDSQGHRPWVIVSGKGGTSEKCPERVDQFLSLLVEYQP